MGVITRSNGITHLEEKICELVNHFTEFIFSMISSKSWWMHNDPMHYNCSSQF